MFLAVIGAGAFFYINSNSMMLPGEWHRSIDLTDDVRRNMEDYLRGVLTEDEILECDFPASVEVDSKLVISKEGKMTERIDETSYYDAMTVTKEALKTAVVKTVEDKLKKSYIETDMTVEELVKEATGMELTDYLEKYGPKMMPTMDELSDLYGMDAEYSADRSSLNITDKTDVFVCDYALSHGMLVIDCKDGARVYHKDQKTAAEEGIQ